VSCGLWWRRWQFRRVESGIVVGKFLKHQFERLVARQL